MGDEVAVAELAQQVHVGGLGRAPGSGGDEAALVVGPAQGDTTIPGVHLGVRAPLKQTAAATGVHQGEGGEAVAVEIGAGADARAQAGTGLLAGNEDDGVAGAVEQVGAAGVSATVRVGARRAHQEQAAALPAEAGEGAAQGLAGLARLTPLLFPLGIDEDHRAGGFAVRGAGAHAGLARGAALETGQAHQHGTAGGGGEGAAEPFAFPTVQEGGWAGRVVGGEAVQGPAAAVVSGGAHRQGAVVQEGEGSAEAVSGLAALPAVGRLQAVEAQDGASIGVVSGRAHEQSLAAVHQGAAQVPAHGPFEAGQGLEIGPGEDEEDAGVGLALGVGRAGRGDGQFGQAVTVAVGDELGLGAETVGGGEAVVAGFEGGEASALAVQNQETAQGGIPRQGSGRQRIAFATGGERETGGGGDELQRLEECADPLDVEEQVVFAQDGDVRSRVVRVGIEEVRGAVPVAVEVAGIADAIVVLVFVVGVGHEWAGVLSVIDAVAVAVRHAGIEVDVGIRVPGGDFFLVGEAVAVEVVFRLETKPHGPRGITAPATLVIGNFETIAETVSVGVPFTGVGAVADFFPIDEAVVVAVVVQGGEATALVMAVSKGACDFLPAAQAVAIGVVFGAVFHGQAQVHIPGVFPIAPFV